MKKSKYFGMKSGDWSCTHVGVARVQPAYHERGRDVNGRKLRSVSAGHRQYYYIFERLTSDAKAMKMIRLSAMQANQVLNGKRTVEDFAQKKERKRSQVFQEKVSYSFCD